MKLNPTPFELCLLAKELGQLSGLRSADERTDQALHAALNLWVRASLIAKRGHIEARELESKLKAAYQQEADRQAETEAKQRERLTIAEAAKRYLGHKDGRMFGTTVRKFYSNNPSELKKVGQRGWIDGHTAEILADYHRELSKLNRGKARRGKSVKK